MIFPIGDDQLQGGYRPYFSYLLIFINVIVFIIQSLDPTGQLYIAEGGTFPALVMNGTDLVGLFTGMFMHGGFMHLLGNMLFLWVFGDNIEGVIGNTKFILLYLVMGILAALAHIISEPASLIPCVGASGAIAGLMGAYLVMFPKSRIKMLFFIRVFSIPAFVFLLFWIGQQLLSGFGSLPMFAGKDGVDGGGVAYWAHIGGFVVGALAGLVFKKAAQSYQLMAEDNQLKAAWERFSGPSVKDGRRRESHRGRNGLR